MTLSLVTSSHTLSTPSLLVGLDASRGIQGFSSSPVISVWALCHTGCTQLWVKRNTPFLVCSSVSFSSPVSVGFPDEHCPSPASCSPLPKLLARPGLLSQLPSLWFPVLLHASSLPFPVISHPSAHLPWFSYLFCLSSLPLFFVQLPLPHFSPAPGFPVSHVLPIPGHLSCF